MHLAQAKIRLPANGRNFLLPGSAGTLTHCKFGYLRILICAGLYLPLNLLNLPKSNEPFWQIVQVLAIIVNYFFIVTLRR